VIRNAFRRKEPPVNLIINVSAEREKGSPSPAYVYVCMHVIMYVRMYVCMYVCAIEYCDKLPPLEMVQFS
jgi:hypothetical protein